MDGRARRRIKSVDTNMVAEPLTRRSFMKSAAASMMSIGRRSTGRSSQLSQLPGLDGELVFDDTSRRAAADDSGHHVHRLPIAVLRPGSVNDILGIVAYANKHGLKIAMRGRGHCLHGRAQAEGGIVIDSSPLNNVRWHGNDALDAQSGAVWGDVAKTALAQGFTPPVLPDALILSVGGTLSVGKIGETSYRYGAQVDHVLELDVELDVVTGAGELVTCSPERNSELFHMVLAGLGQCGTIVRARLGLAPAPKYVAMRAFRYDKMDAFLSDQVRLATSGRVVGKPFKCLNRRFGRYAASAGINRHVVRNERVRRERRKRLHLGP